MTAPFFELLLAGPLPRGWLRVLLFAGFAAHLSLVLLALGTAFLSVVFCAASCLRGEAAIEGWPKEILRTFLGFKSLAVVLGVAPLLIIQVGGTLPFFNATGLLAGLWMLVIALLVVSFLSFDALGHGVNVHPFLHLGLGLAALVLFAVVPGIFTAVLTAAENPARWPAALGTGGFLPRPLVFHWLMRYLHVLGAALVAGALAHYFLTSRGRPDRQGRLRAWLVAGIMVQVVVGPLLLVSLPRGLDLPAIAILAAGLLFLAAFAWLVAGRRRAAAGSLGLKGSAALFLGVVLCMLLVRQSLQDRAFGPLEAEAEAGRKERAAALAPYREPALADYLEDMGRVYDNGRTIYAGSCAFCHGEKGDGAGPEAGKLAIPPEDLIQVRASRPHLLQVLAAGVPGTAMPYFAVFVRGKLEDLLDTLDGRWNITGARPELAAVPAADLAAARKIYDDRCAACHGPDGRPTAAGERLEPPPPPFTEYSLLPQRTIEVFTHGYPGTAMGPFGAGLGPGIEMALVQVLYEKRRT
jgi:mono/diheme cytochrome c family protein